jgi:hypothetical protein
MKFFQFFFLSCQPKTCGLGFTTTYFLAKVVVYSISYFNAFNLEWNEEHDFFVEFVVAHALK